jgi:hypothetical protein
MVITNNERESMKTTLKMRRKSSAHIENDREMLVLDFTGKDDIKAGTKDHMAWTGPRLIVRRCRHGWQLLIHANSGDPSHRVTVRDSGQVIVRKEQES